MTYEQLMCSTAIDNAYNDYKYGDSISKLNADFLKETKRFLNSTNFWNLVREYYDDRFYSTVQKALS